MPSIDYLTGLKTITREITNGLAPKEILRLILHTALEFSGGKEAVFNLSREHLKCITDVDEAKVVDLSLGENTRLVSDHPASPYEIESEEDIAEDMEPMVIEKGDSFVLRFQAGEITLVESVVDVGSETKQKLSLTILADLLAGILKNAIDSKVIFDRVKAQEREYKQLLRHNTSLQTKAMIDNLTGLHNRGFFERSLRYELERYQRYKTSMGVIMFDVDHFKAVNDIHGHLVGDASLKHLANVAKASLRNADILARYGGDEFIALLPHTTGEGANITAKRLRQNVEGAPLNMDDGEIHLTVSVGVTVLSSGDTPAAADVLRSADRALYRAKNAGRNRVSIAEDLSH